MRVPQYYFNFKCIADKCRHSCCVGWEIDVDERTLARYRALPAEKGNDILQSIAETEDGVHFRLCTGERCPHLDEKGLCRIITALGEGYLCDICREHPRFYHEIGGVWECGLGLACEEAARLILSAENYADFAEIADGEEEFTPETVGDFNAFAYRAALYADLRKNEIPLAERLAKIEAEYGLGVTLTRDAHRSLFEGLEYLNEAHRALLAEAYCADFAPTGARSDACERFFAYLVFRHASAAADLGEFATAVSLATCLTRVFDALASANGLPPVEYARILSEELEYSEENTAAIRAALENEKKGV
jgi:lysine-N-methylase